MSNKVCVVLGWLIFLVVLNVGVLLYPEHIDMIVYVCGLFALVLSYATIRLRG